MKMYVTGGQEVCRSCSLPQRLEQNVLKAACAGGAGDDKALGGGIPGFGPTAQRCQVWDSLSLSLKLISLIRPKAATMPPITFSPKTAGRGEEHVSYACPPLGKPTLSQKHLQHVGRRNGV